MISKHCSAIALTTAAITVDELSPPPDQLCTIMVCNMCASVKAVCLKGYRETFHCSKYIHIIECDVKRRDERPNLPLKPSFNSQALCVNFVLYLITQEQ